MPSTALSGRAAQRECKLAIAEPDSTITLTWARQAKRVAQTLENTEFHCLALTPPHALEGRLHEKLVRFEQFLGQRLKKRARSKTDDACYLVVYLGTDGHDARKWQTHSTKSSFVKFMTQATRKCLAPSATRSGEPVVVAARVPADYPQKSTEFEEVLHTVDALFEAPSRLPTHFPAFLHGRLAQARDEFQQRHRMLSSAEVAKLSGYASESNQAAPAYRMQSRGEIFSLPVGGRMSFPAFQFDAASGCPLPVVAELLKAWPEGSDRWSLALWLDGPNPYLEHRRPVELLATQAHKVLEAAKAQASIERF